MPVQISVNGLAKFMKGAAAAQRTLLQSYKFPFDANGRKRPQIVRYSEARAAIRKYHESGNDVSILLKAIEDLIRKEVEHPEKDGSRISAISCTSKLWINFEPDWATSLKKRGANYVHLSDAKNQVDKIRRTQLSCRGSYTRDENE